MLRALPLPFRILLPLVVTSYMLGMLYEMAAYSSLERKN